MQASPRSQAHKALSALLAVQLLFGLHYSAAREITAHIDPNAWTLLRQAGGALLLLLLMLALRRPWPRVGWPRLFVLSLLGVAFNQLLFNLGIRRSTALHAVLVVATVPALTLAFGVLLRQETLTRRKLTSVALGALGIALLMQVDQLAVGTASLWLTRAGQPAASFSDSVLCGDLLIFANAVCYALYLALSKRTSEQVEALTLTAALFLCALPVTLLFGASALAELEFSAVPPQIWLLALGIVLGPTLLAYLLNLYALRRLPTSLVGLFINLQFLVAAATAALWHGERLDLRLALAALAVLAGLSLRFLPEKPGA